MYRVVELARPDQDLHRFLCRATPAEYRMTHVNFGVAASPYLALKSLQKTAEDFGSEHPKASPYVTQSFYVDDLLAGVDTPEEASHLQVELRALLRKGGFDLRKWRSSSR